MPQTIPTPAGAHWFIAVGKDRNGPFDEAALREKIVNGELADEQRIWRKGMKDWEHSKNVPEVKAIHQALEAERYNAPRWYVAVNKKPTGPFSDAQVEAKIGEGEVQDKSKLWRHGQDAWKPLSAVDELLKVRERGASKFAQSLPPALDDEPPGPSAQHEPPALVPESAVHTSPPELSAAAASQTAPTAPAERVLAPFHTDPSLPAWSTGREPRKALIADEACQAVRHLFPGDRRVDGALQVIQRNLRKDMLNGNLFGLDKGMAALGAFIKAAVGRSGAPAHAGQALQTSDTSHTPQKAMERLKAVHGEASLQAQHINRNNFLADRMLTTFGVTSRPSWGIAPRV